MSNKVNILLVDDNPEGLVTLRAVLDNPQYNLICATSGAEALRHVLAFDFAVILMDVQLSDMDGFETAKVIKQRERSKDIPIIFVTAIDKADGYVSHGYAVGAVDYLFKPFDPNILKSKVSVFVDLYRKSLKLIQQSMMLRDLEKRETARILSELEIESRRRYQSLADAVPQILWRANKFGDAEYFNHFWHLYSGLSLDQSPSLAWQYVTHVDDLNMLQEKWAQALKDKAGFEAECRLLRAEDGAYRWHLLRIMPEFDNLSEVMNWIGTATDIHDQKLYQCELMRAKEAADMANETKSRFLANMSHEIRTPLGAILGFTEVLVSHDLSREKKAEYISTIRRNGEQLSKIIDEILDLSKVEAGKLEVETTDVPLVELLNDVRSLMSVAAKEKDLELEFKVKSPIPTKIQTDPTRLRQILINIIGNGIKFSPHGKVEVEVSLINDKKLPQKDWQNDWQSQALLCVSVTDSGPGLSVEQIKSLFKPFSQVDSSISRKYGGTGLGLTLSRNFARALGGDVTISESHPNEGCHFTITVKAGSLLGVPLTNSLIVSPHISNFTKEHDESSTLDGVKVLFVDDSEDNQELVTHFLESAGAQVDLASNGLEGVEKAMGGDHNVILMDVQMPILDGYMATSQLRKQGYKKPIIALTAHAMKDERQRCLQVGCNDYLTKPLNHLVLIERIFNYSQVSRQDLANLNS